MPIIIDHQLREQIPHDVTAFPITYFHDELATIPNWEGPFHWHPDFEIATAINSTLDYQVGQQHITLKPGDSIFVNGNILHSIKQISGNTPEPMPNIVFSGTIVATDTSEIYQKYILPIKQCDSLPFVVFQHENKCHKEVNHLIKEIYNCLREKNQCYEMIVQRALSRIFEYIFCNLDELPKNIATRIQINNQIRIQKMLSFIYEHYAETITLEDIAHSANISRSEAGRCFNSYMGISPVDALIKYRLQMAYRMLNENIYTLQEISYACGFNSANYFSRQFKKNYGYAPGQKEKLGK